ncbi:MAG: hypothetical protein QM586_05370 [Xenophilus sp.]
MPDIHIERRHAPGLPLARQIARRWLGRLESDFRLQCRHEEGTQDDQVGHAVRDAAARKTAARARKA